MPSACENFFPGREAVGRGCRRGEKGETGVGAEPNDCETERPAVGMEVSGDLPAHAGCPGLGP